MDSVSRKEKRGQRRSSALLPPRRRKSARLAAAAAAAVQWGQEQRDAAAESSNPRLSYKEADTYISPGVGDKKAKAEPTEVKIEPLIMPYKEAHTYIAAGGGDKKPNAEPTVEDMKPLIIPILKRVQWSRSTRIVDHIIEKLGTHFGCDLRHRMSEIAYMTVDVVNSSPPNFLCL